MEGGGVGNYVIMSRQSGTGPDTFQLFHNIIIPFVIPPDHHYLDHHRHGFY